MGAYKLNIGDATHYLKWDGVALTIKGLVGDITLNTTGFVRTSGKDNYADLTAGFFLGYDGGAYKLNIGDDTKYIKWDGATLTIKGMTSFGSITLDANGFIKTTGKDSYADNTAGFWLGYDGIYKLNIGNANNWLKWTGSALQIKGRLSVGLNTNEDIYFEDSGIRMYDIGNYKIGFSKSEYPSLFLGLATDGVNTGRLNGSFIGFYNNNNIILNAVSKSFMFYSTGTLQLVQLETAPTAHVADLTYHIDQGNNPHFHGYIGPPDNTWGKMELTAPNW